MIYYALFGFAAVLLAVALGWFYLRRRVGRAIGSAQTQSLLQEFTAGIAIPMLDGETWPKEKR